ncbi:MAG: cyclic pyranopterin monophosphate synthase MoaC [candidate division Zixibacteria bacterium]|nr:cyclic pyranopterin monophosphate synthase MoaC [candidate division Zixibacteria bacterium]
MSKLSHVDDKGKAQMVNVGNKESTDRVAVARATVLLNKETFIAIKENKMAKGDVLTVAKIAGIQAAKQTSSLIPLCHPLPLDLVDIAFEMDSKVHSITITASSYCRGKTGVEMESLTACSIAALTIYDMSKAMQKDITITDIMLIKKTGGKSGEYIRDNI